MAQFEAIISGKAYKSDIRVRYEAENRHAVLDSIKEEHPEFETIELYLVEDGQCHFLRRISVGEEKITAVSIDQIASDPPETLFVPFVRGSTAGMNQQFTNIGGRDTGNPAVMGVAGELTELVKKHKSMGYEFQKIETIHVDVSPGCIGMLMGKGKEYHPYDYLVFKKSDSQQFTSPV